MKSIISIFVFCFALSGFAAPTKVFIVDVKQCVDNLVWNSRYTTAKCKIRDARVSEDPNTPALPSLHFTLPPLTEFALIFVTVHPLRDGYILKIKSEAPMVPSYIEGQLIHTLEIAFDDGGIIAPEGFCARWLSELNNLP